MKVLPHLESFATPSRGLCLGEAPAERERLNPRVRVGPIGAGQMGTDIIVQIVQMPGMSLRIILC